MHAYVHVFYRKGWNLARKQQNTSLLTARLTRGLGQFLGVKVQEAAYDHADCLVQLYATMWRHFPFAVDCPSCVVWRDEYIVITLYSNPDSLVENRAQFGPNRDVLVKKLVFIRIMASSVFLTFCTTYRPIQWIVILCMESQYLTSRSYLKTGQQLPQTEHWDRLKINFLLLQFSIDVFFFSYVCYPVCQGWLIWKIIIVQVWVSSPISSEAWLQFVYCPGLNCVVWQGVPHFNHSGREEVVWSFSLCPLVVPLAFLNISFDGHCEHLQSWLTESILLIILKVWIMSVLCLL